MGHVTTDNLTDAWKKLNQAEQKVMDDIPDLAIGPIGEAIDCVQKSAYGMDMLQKYIDLGGGQCRERLGVVKSRQEKDESEILELISDLRDLLREIKDPIEEELHHRLRTGEDNVYGPDTPDDRMPTAKYQDR